MHDPQAGVDSGDSYRGGPNIQKARVVEPRSVVPRSRHETELSVQEK